MVATHYLSSKGSLDLIYATYLGLPPAFCLIAVNVRGGHDELQIVV